MVPKISKPTLLIDEKKVGLHILEMLKKAAANNAVLRPHFKTHQSGLVGQWFRQLGVKAITVSSVTMAQYFALHDWKDILIAFPVNLLEINAINQLAASVSLQLLLEDKAVAAELSKQLSASVGVYIKIDVGARRTGIPMHEEARILALVKAIKELPNLELMGFLAHAGQHYHAGGGFPQIAQSTKEAAEVMGDLRRKSGDQSLILSWGDTPSCSMLEVLEGFDEWRPGNFVYYDVMQYHIGACRLDEIAVAVVCPVVAIHAERNEMVIYGGAVHFSTEFIAADQGFRLYGYLVKLNSDGWSDPIAGAWLTGLSQEHGLVRLPKELLQQFKPGDLIGILPVHACLTVDAIGDQYTLMGQLVPKMNTA
ncbi:MAG: alanine racemase [Bacteroidetes bacterium]|nr:alanine racemase [Bacteroidota bacterium]MBU1581014.1 alanine racemase [Bacteroidota bacterium]MBU2557558.1 alanine racemase [Bacteroidota bacterium]